MIALTSQYETTGKQARSFLKKTFPCWLLRDYGMLLQTRQYLNMDRLMGNIVELAA
jgi:hypothetical protein